MEFKIVVKNDKGEYIHESEFMDSERAMAYIRSYIVLNIVSQPTQRALDSGEVLPPHKHVYIDGYCACGSYINRRRQ